ncbi:MAG: hypothetical protein AAGH57_01405 [Pseudomonadota bacterium]
MTWAGLYSLGAGFSLLSLAIALAANHRFRRFERLPGFWNARGQVSRLDSRYLSIFLSPVLLTLAIGAVLIGFSFAQPETLEGVSAGILGPGLGLVFSQLWMWRKTDSWAQTQI